MAPSMAGKVSVVLWGRTAPSNGLGEGPRAPQGPHIRSGLHPNSLVSLRFGEPGGYAVLPYTQTGNRTESQSVQHRYQALHSQTRAPADRGVQPGSALTGPQQARESSQVLHSQGPSRQGSPASSLFISSRTGPVLGSLSPPPSCSTQNCSGNPSSRLQLLPGWDLSSIYQFLKAKKSGLCFRALSVAALSPIRGT